MLSPLFLLLAITFFVIRPIIQKFKKIIPNLQPNSNERTTPTKVLYNSALTKEKPDLLLRNFLIFQQKFSGQATASQQQKMMGYFMPVFMVLFFNTFPSGLNLYYSLFNILSVVQTKYLSDGFFSKKKSEKSNS